MVSKSLQILILISLSVAEGALIAWYPPSDYSPTYEWTDSANWNTSTVPGADDDVFIEFLGSRGATQAINIPNSLTIKSLYFYATGAYLQGKGITTSSMTVTGDINWILGGVMKMTLNIMGNTEFSNTYDYYALNSADATINNYGIFSVQESAENYWDPVEEFVGFVNYGTVKLNCQEFTVEQSLGYIRPCIAIPAIGSSNGTWDMTGLGTPFTELAPWYYEQTDTRPYFNLFELPYYAINGAGEGMAAAGIQFFDAVTFGSGTVFKGPGLITFSGEKSAYKERYYNMTFMADTDFNALSINVRIDFLAVLTGPGALTFGNLMISGGNLTGGAPAVVKGNGFMVVGSSDSYARHFTLKNRDLTIKGNFFFSTDAAFKAYNGSVIMNGFVYIQELSMREVDKNSYVYNAPTGFLTFTADEAQIKGITLINDGSLSTNCAYTSSGEDALPACRVELDGVYLGVHSNVTLNLYDEAWSSFYGVDNLKKADYLSVNEDVSTDGFGGSVINYCVLGGTLNLNYKTTPSIGDFHPVFMANTGTGCQGTFGTVNAIGLGSGQAINMSLISEPSGYGLVLVYVKVVASSDKHTANYNFGAVTQSLPSKFSSATVPGAPTPGTPPGTPPTPGAATSSYSNTTSSVSSSSRIGFSIMAVLLYVLF